MHDTHDVRKSKELETLCEDKRLHDLEMLIDENRTLRPSDLSDDQVFRCELIEVLERIANALEKPLQVRSQY